MKPARKGRREDAPAPPAEVAAAPPALPSWVFVLALVIALIIYLPALRGPFVFDDLTLPVLQKQNSGEWTQYLTAVRPLYYLNLLAQYRLHGDNPLPFHLVNWLLHALNALLLYGIVSRYCRLAELPGRDAVVAAAFGAGLFLLHPLNTEAVSYIASRSEVLSVLFAFLAWRLFLDRREPRLGLGAMAGILALLALALAVKEHVIALIAVFLLTDFLFGGWRANLRFYLPLGLFGAGAAAHLLARASNTTAGFGVEGVTPAAYFTTQGAVIWRYLQLSVLPVGQSVDHAIPIGLSILGIAGWAAIAAVALWLWRKGPKLALFGWLVFLAMLAPTSSIVPIADAMAERRLYLALPGLVLLGAPWVRQAKPWLLGGVLVALALVTWNRNEKWASSEALWRDAIAGNPANARAQFQLAHALYLDGRCADSLPHFERADQHGGAETALFVDWALALDCAGQPDEALAILGRAREESHLRWSTMGMIEGKRGRSVEALAALDRALELRPRFAMSWVYRGNVLVGLGRRDEAAENFRRALQIDPDNAAARQGLAAAAR
ncbi:MAG: tetratricopeptide repeat protein [Bryobacteraceae bacterium]|nr:tetratricopeptide repeat protein [Bryobacteraceae bacterium]